MSPSLIIGLASLATSLGSSISGNAKANKANAEKQALINQQLAEVDNQLKQNFVDTPEARAVLENAKENMHEQATRDESRAAMTGATHEAKLAAREKANKTYADTLRKVAGFAGAWRNNLQNKKAAILGQQVNNYTQQAIQAGNQVESGINGMISSAGTIAAGTTNNPNSPEANQLRQNFNIEKYQKTANTPFKLTG
jgi:hypothetical protein